MKFRITIAAIQEDEENIPDEPDIELGSSNATWTIRADLQGGVTTEEALEIIVGRKQ